MNAVPNAPLNDLLAVGSSGVYALFSGTYIPEAERLSKRIGFDEAATIVRTWLEPSP